MNADTYHDQLAESADHIGAAIARAALTSDPLELETLAIQLRGTATLALHLRNAILTTPPGAGTHRDDPHEETAA